MKNELIAATTTALLTAALMVPAVRAGATESGGLGRSDRVVHDRQRGRRRTGLLGEDLGPPGHRGDDDHRRDDPRASPRLDDVDGGDALHDRAQGELLRQRGVQLIRSPLRDERHRGDLALEGCHSEHRHRFGPDVLRTMKPEVLRTLMHETPACSSGARVGGRA